MPFDLNSARRATDQEVAFDINSARKPSDAEVAAPPAAPAKKRDNRSYGRRAVDAGLGLLSTGAKGVAGAVGGAAGLLEAGGRALTFQGDTLEDQANLIDARRQGASDLIPDARGNEDLASVARDAYHSTPEGVQAGAQTALEAAAPVLESPAARVAMGGLDALGVGATGAGIVKGAVAKATRKGAVQGAENLAAREAVTANPNKVGEFVRQGYKVSTAGVRPHTPGGQAPIGQSVLESISGPTPIRGEYAIQNQTNTNRLLRQEIGLGEGGTITDADVARVRQPHNAVYREIERIPGRFKSTPAMQNAVATIDRSANGNPFFAPNQEVRRLIERVNSAGDFTAHDLLEAVKEFRRQANFAYKAGGKSFDPDLGDAYRAAANTLEDSIDQIASSSGNPTLRQRLTQARTALAKINDIDNARMGDNVDAHLLARLGEKSPLSGNLKVVADAAVDFPDETRLGTTVNISPPNTATMFGAVRSGLQTGARNLGGRALLDRYQRGMVGAEPIAGIAEQAPAVGAPRPPLVEPTGGVAGQMAGDLSLADELGAGGVASPVAQGGLPGPIALQTPERAPGMELGPNATGAELPPATAGVGDLTASAPVGPQGGLDLGAIQPIIEDIVSALGLGGGPEGGLPFEGLLPTAGDSAGLRLADELAPAGPAAGMPGIDFPEPRPQAPLPTQQVEAFGPAFELTPPEGTPGEFPPAPRRQPPLDDLGSAMVEPGPRVPPNKPAPAAAAAEPELSDLLELGLVDEPPAPPRAELELAPESPAGPDASTQARYSDRYIDPSYKTIESDGGYLAYEQTEPGVRQIRSAYTKPEARGKGQGQELLLRAAREAREAGDTLNSDAELSADQWRVYQKLFKKRQLTANYDPAEIDAALEAGGGKARNKSGQPWITDIRPRE